MIKHNTIIKTVLSVAKEFDSTAQATICKNVRKHTNEVKSIIRHTSSIVNPSVLDIGGGMGVNLMVLSKLGYSSNLCLLDRFDEYESGTSMGIITDNIYALIERFSIRLVKQDVVLDQTLPFDDGSFDIVTLIDLIEHLPTHPITLLRESKRVLKHNSYIYLASPNLFGLSEVVKFFSGKHIYIKFEAWLQDNYYSHYREYTKTEHKKLLTISGFSVKKTRLVNNISMVNIKSSVMSIIVSLLPFFKGTVYAIGQKE